MAVAISRGDTQAMIYGVIAMILIIVVLDFAIWHPILSWVRRFRLEEVPGVHPTEPLMLLALRDSRLIRLLKYFYRRSRQRRHHKSEPLQITSKLKKIAPVQIEQNILFKKSWRYLEPTLWLALAFFLVLATGRLFKVLATLPGSLWVTLLSYSGLTFLRILGALVLSTLWAVPVGIWLGLSYRRIRIAQPFIQILASFPAPMLYPLALTLFFSLGISLNWGSMFLMMMGVQWYVLFNVLAGALRIPRELGDTLSLMKCSKLVLWRTLYLPSVFPALVTGWVTAAGGAWNASMVAEYISYKGQVLQAKGLGAAISAAAGSGDFHGLVASLTLMIIVVLAFNRLVWSRVYTLAQTRFRMDN